MRPVNLLPPRYRRARATGERPGVGYIALGVLAVLFLMVLGVVVTNNGINDAKDKTASANARLAAAQAKSAGLQGYANFQQLKASRESAVEQIAFSRFDWERLMREMALVLPHNTYLTAFSAGPGTATTDPTTGAPITPGPSVTLTGCAPSHPGVATAIVRLRRIHGVTDVTLGTSSKAAATAGAGAVPCKTTFTATVTFAAESVPSLTAPVPARLGGGQ